MSATFNVYLVYSDKLVYRGVDQIKIKKEFF